MKNDILKQIKTGFLLLIFMTVLTGLIYPVVVTGLAQLLFSSQANGSLIKQDDQIVGSLLIGQSFTDPRYFWGRPSATMPYPYNAASSSGSNLGPSNPDLLTAVKGRIEILQKANPKNNKLIPVDLVTTSASGLDPDISPEAAFYQVARVAKARKLPEKIIQTLVENAIQGRLFGLIGESRVNVLQLNMALDRLKNE